MKDEAQLREDVNRAQAAERLLENPMLKEAVKAAREKAQRQFENSKPGDEGKSEREEAYYMIRALDRVVKEIYSHVKTGKVSAKILEDERERDARSRALGREGQHSPSPSP